MKNKAFTLAEVLITLGIIGVVAALTMPSLMANYQKKVTATRLAKAYSVMSQAIKLSEVDNGDAKDWDWAHDPSRTTNTEFIMKTYFEPYFSGIKYCDSGITNKCGMSISNWGRNYILNDNTGLSVVLGPPYSPGDILFDTNGGNPPNKLGRDVFYFIIDYEGRLLPLNWAEDVPRETIMSNYAGYGCNETDKYNCAWLIMNDNWEIKPDYPW